MKFHSAIPACAVSLLVSLLAGRSLAAHIDAVSAAGEYNALGPWDSNAMPTSHRHGRELSFTSIQECVGQGYPAAFCACVLDGNDSTYCAVCGAALANSGFSLSNTQRFTDWFTDESVLNLAQTGSYKGIAGITEYVNFIYSIFFDAYDLLGDPAAKFIANPNFASDGTCIVAFASNRQVSLNQDYYDDPCYKTTVGSTVYYTPTSEDDGYINVVKADVWYPEDYIEAVFANLRHEEAVEWLCGVIHDNCPATWKLNNFDNNDNKCRANYGSLPTTEGDLAAADGKSLGCKILHATFVPLNPFHCAHTSFVKEEDLNGVEKCQKTNGVSPEDIFTTEMLDFFAFAGENYFGYDADLLYDPNASC